MTQFATKQTPIPSKSWMELSSIARLELVKSVTASTKFNGIFDPVSALPSGFVYVEIVPTLSAAERGLKLREFESFLKKEIDEGLSVWCEPVGDKSALRKLRGIEVKAI